MIVSREQGRGFHGALECLAWDVGDADGGNALVIRNARSGSGFLLRRQPIEGTLIRLIRPRPWAVKLLQQFTAPPHRTRLDAIGDLLTEPSLG